MSPRGRKVAMRTGDKKKQTRWSAAELRLLLFWVSIKTVVLCVVNYLKYLWQHNPLRVLSQRQRRLYFVESYGEVMIKPRFKERVMDVFLSDYRRRQRLLKWVNSRLVHCEVHDFCTCWQDGTMLCALLESICPGVCPSYHLLSHHNRVKNCRLGLKLANKYLYLPMDLLSPEEMAIATKSSENKIIQYISMLKWASENIKEKWSSLHESLIAAKSGRCFAKGSGLRNGIVGKRSKFTIIVSDTIGVFNLLVEVRGPNNEYCGERIVSLHQAKGVLGQSFDMNKTYADTIKYLEDGVGNTFIRKKVPARQVIDKPGDLIHLDFQCGEEGTFYITFVPRRAGMHTVAVKWQNHHVECSPFRVKVYKASNVSTKNLKGAQEKRVIYDSLSFTTYTGSSQDSIDHLEVEKEEYSPPCPEAVSEEGRSLSAIAKSKAYSKGRQLTVTRRRVLRRIITRNGEDIVIEEAISPSLSRQSSITDNSDEDNKYQRKGDTKSGSPSNVTSPLAATATTSISTTKHASHGLGTVLEERQGSKEDSPANTTVDRAKQLCRKKDSERTDLNESTVHQQQQEQSSDQDKYTPDMNTDSINENKDMITASRLTYTCTELDEHNILDRQAPAKNDRSRDPAEIYNNRTTCNSTSKTAYFFGSRENSTGDSTTAQALNSKRCPLRRTMSIHSLQKRAARRTTSDGPIYKLRKDIVSFAASDRSETESEMSSDDKQSVCDDEQGLTSPALKLLHSSSLNKACVYISEKTLNNSLSSYTDDDVTCDDMYELAFPAKAKVTATQSLPIMRKMWTRDEAQAPFKDFLHNMNKIETDSNFISSSMRTDSCYSEGTDKSEWPTSSFDIPNSNESQSNEQFKIIEHGESFENIQNTIEVRLHDAANDLKKHAHLMNENTNEDPSSPFKHQTDNVDIDINIKSFEDELNTENVLTNNEKLNHSISHTHTDANTEIQCAIKQANRGSLTRQWTIFGQKSSGDSSSENEKSKLTSNYESSLEEILTDAKTLKKELENNNSNQIEKHLLDKPTVKRGLEQTKSDSLEENLHTSKMRYSETERNRPNRLEENVHNGQNQNLRSDNKRNDNNHQKAKNLKSEFERKNSFRSLSLQSNSSKQPNYTTKVSIVIPKPKVDKSTQVCDSEITAETGWDAIEGVYLLLRRIRVNVPFEFTSYFNSNNKSVLDVSHPKHNNDDINKVAADHEQENEESGLAMDIKSIENKSQLSVPVDVNSYVENPDEVVERNDNNDTAVHDIDIAGNNDIHNDIDFSKRQDIDILRTNCEDIDSINNNGLRETLGIGNFANVDAWFERNEHMLNSSSNTLVPVRQYTIETVDSGFDDNPTHYNRHARFSLPSLRSANGHVRLYRRSYGGRIALDPKLVNSASSQSMSIERRDLGNEADDELMNTSITKDDIGNKHQRRRHKLRYREKSFSLSDSELNQRQRTTIRKRHFASKRISLRVQKFKNAVHAVNKESHEIVENNDRISQRSSVCNRISEASDACDTTDNEPDGESKSKHGKPSYKMDLGKACPPLVWENKSSTNTSSMDSNYCGFGVSKLGRNNMLSYLGAFQNLYPTAELADEHDSINQNDISMEIPAFNINEDPSADELKADYITETRSTSSSIDDEFQYVKETRSMSWDGVLDDIPYSRFAIDEDDDDDDDEDDQDVGDLIHANGSSNRSPAETDSVSEEIEGRAKSPQVFDIFSSFDHSHLNDVLPRQETLRLQDVDEQEASEEVQQTIVRVAGVGLQYGQVGANNSFQVWVENPTNSSLSVNVIGPRSHTVTQTSIMYTGDNLYEVSYEVTQPGFYKIFVKWGDQVVADSPYICEILYCDV